MPESPAPPRVAVVIPFFQRKPGILARTVQSALGQDGDIPLRIIVADDSSPIPAEQELAPLLGPAQGRITIVRRANGGPAKARNTGLDHVPPGCPYVAFLDSDDVWQPGHLKRALAALDRGFDLYFADWRFANETETAFQRTGFDPARGKPQGEGVWEMPESLFDRTFGRDNMTHLSTTVYRFSAFPDLRFVDELSMGEDIIFYLDLACRNARAVASSGLDMIRGAAEIGAVNIYEGSGWGSPRALWRLSEELRYVRLLGTRYPLSVQNRQWYARRRSALQEDFVLAVLHRLRRGQLGGLGAVVPATAIDPGVILALPRVVLRRATRVSA
ncbi:MAG: glycosyltransferase family 2 protein [Alphaproteobacteria bacterium]